MSPCARALWVVLSATAAVGGCSVVSPPPITAPHALATPASKGTSTISVLFGVGGGLWIDGGKGVEVRVAHQLTTRNEVGVGIGLARADDNFAERARRDKKAERECSNRRRGPTKGHPLFGISCTRTTHVSPDQLVAIRAFGRFTPDPDGNPWLAATFGVGLGTTDTKLTWMTVDLGMRVSTTGNAADVYANPVIAISVPLRRGPKIDKKEVPTSLWFGTSLGLIGNGDNRLAGSIDLTMLAGKTMMVFMTAAGRYQTTDP